MSQLTTLLTGAGVTTIVAGQAQCEQNIIIGSIATAFPLQGIAVEIDGVPFLNINNSATLLAAYSKWMNQANASGAIVGVALKITTGRIKKSTTYRFVNNGATTPNVFAFSTNDNGVPFQIATKTINITSYEDFQNFSAIFFLPTNVSNCEFTFMNGYRATLTTTEVDALFGIRFPNEGGELGGISVIDNRNQSIANIRINNGAVATTVLVAKIPDSAFKMMKKLAQA